MTVATTSVLTDAEKVERLLDLHYEVKFPFERIEGLAGSCAACDKDGDPEGLFRVTWPCRTARVLLS